MGRSFYFGDRGMSYSYLLIVLFCQSMQSISVQYLDRMIAGTQNSLFTKLSQNSTDSYPADADCGSNLLVGTAQLILFL